MEALSRCNLYWRSFSHWLGGMGILVFLLAVVPEARKSAGSGMYLMRAESPWPSVGKLTPHLRQTALILYGLYMLLTVLCIGFLLLGGMPLFDSLCIAFGTAGTGGFAIRNSGMADYSAYLQNVVTVFHVPVRREFQPVLPASAAPVQERFPRTRSCGCTRALRSAGDRADHASTSAACTAASARRCTTRRSRSAAS